jgi:hypothetical protein
MLTRHAVRGNLFSGSFLNRFQPIQVIAGQIYIERKLENLPSTLVIFLSGERWMNFSTESVTTELILIITRPSEPF